MVKKKTQGQKTNRLTGFKTKKWHYIVCLGIFVLLILLVFSWHYRAGIRYYIGSWKGKHGIVDKEAKYDIRNVEIMNRHSDKVFGIDISQYQGEIKWIEVNTINDQFPIDFVFMRATMGEVNKDERFDDNWNAAATRANLRGAYHYFRPNENSVKQAKNFIKTVKLEPGDLPPVLDIEEMPKGQSMDSLKVGLKRWLDEVEVHYKVKPILYSGDKYFSDFLQQEFSNYVLWIANYNFWVEDLRDHWNFWQFSEKGTVTGIRGNVDLNIFNGSIGELEALTIPFKN